MTNQIIYTFNKKLNQKIDGDSLATFLNGVYKQLVPNRRGRQTNGEYKIALNRMPVDEKKEFAVYVANSMQRYGMPHHAAKIREHYELGTLEGKVQ